MLFWLVAMVVAQDPLEVMMLTNQMKTIRTMNHLCQLEILFNLTE
jgi:hypothetical protein